MKANFISHPTIGYVTGVEWDENPYYEVMHLDNERKVVSKHFDTMKEVRKYLSKFKITTSTRYIKY